MNIYYLPFLMAFGISFLLTPVAMKLAYKIGAIDVPKDNRRVHKKPIPRLGGVAIYGGTLITTLVFLKHFTGVLEIRQLMGIGIGATLITGMGIVDDVKPLRAKLKLGIQILAAFILVWSGVRIDFFTNYLSSSGYIYLSSAMFSIPITVFWVVGITNTVNLIDGLDGLAGGVSVIASITLAYVAHISGQSVGAVMLIILAASCLGFLPHNFNPARIFMGDTGALFLGYMLAAISIVGVLKSATAFVVPILALGLPIFDTTFAIVRRYLNGKPIMEADKGHLHHRWLHIGLSQKRAVLVLYLKSALMGFGAVFLFNHQYLNGIIALTLTGILLMIPINQTMDLDKKSLDEES